MRWTHIIWDHTPSGNVEHVEEHDLTTDEVDYVLSHPTSKATSHSSGCPCLFGYTPDGRYIIVVYEEYNDTIYPKTAYEVDEP